VPTSSHATEDPWTELDQRAVDTARVLAMDAVQRVGNGHPGTAMSLAPAAYLLFQRFMRHDPSNPDWVGRDRFVLSPGHTSLTLYIQLFLSGYDIQLDDLKQFRTWGSRTPGHPEHGHTAGVETTTGPLGQGLANGVGMAMAARYERGLFDPDAAAGESVFDHTVWVIASDGDLQEGVSGEASSLAGVQKLGNLVVVYDDNHISIEGDTAAAFTEDVLQRYAAYGWQVHRVDKAADGDVDVKALAAALEGAKATTDRPSLIALRTTIAWPAPNAQNTAASHGSALGATEVATTKARMGFDPEQHFAVESEVLDHARQVARRGREAREAWEGRFALWSRTNPDRAALFERVSRRKLPDGWDADLPVFDGASKATRAASGEVLKAAGQALPELWGGSADLAESNNTTFAPTSFLPKENPTPGADPYGRTVHFGIREHAMGAIMNGIALHGGTRIYGGTFLVFSDYMRPAVRLAALMRLPVTYIWTHDSIGLGEDGPTHQPVEHLATLRAIPGLNVVRPADANETVECWREVFRRQQTRPAPHGFALTRQAVPVLAPSQHAATGGYIAAEASDGRPDLILLATGSEVHLALSARDLLESEGIATRVVSMPCVEWFAEQPQEWRDHVLPPDLCARVAIEAGTGLTWHRYVGDAGRVVSLEHFGASADQATLFREFGFTPEAIAAAARDSLAGQTQRVVATSAS
jgi:transketolase